MTINLVCQSILSHHKEFHHSCHRDPKFSLVIAMQSSSNHHTAGRKPNIQKKVFPVHLSVLLIKVVKFPLFWYLWDHLSRNVNKFYLFYVEIYPLITIPCSKGVDSGWHCKSSISNFVNSFLSFKTCFDIFVLQNSPMVGPLLPTWWQSSMSLSDTATLAFVILFANHVLKIYVTDWWWCQRSWGSVLE